jgi:hypothetical protein
MADAGLDFGEGAQVVDAQSGIGPWQLVQEVIGDALTEITKTWPGKGHFSLPPHFAGRCVDRVAATPS